jgi:uncharacterized protein YbjT (DUF2867 family)
MNHVEIPLRRGLLAAALAASLVLALGLARAAPAYAAATPSGTPKAKSVLVFGGAGKLGAEIVHELVAKGHDVTVFVRPTSNRERLAGLPVKYVEGDVLKEDDVRRAFESRHFDVAVDALARSESGVDFYATAGAHIATWVGKTGVGQAIMHSSIGVGDSRRAYPPAMYERMSPVFVAKGAAEEALRKSGARWTIIRNGVLLDLPQGATDQAQLVPDEGRFGPVSRRGLARLTAQCIETRECDGRIFHGIDAALPIPERRREGARS